MQVLFAADNSTISHSPDSLIADSSYHSLIVPANNEIDVIGIANSRTTPTFANAAEQKLEVPGGFTLVKNDRPETKNFHDLLANVPGVFLQTDGGTEESRVSIRGSGIQTEYEPLGLQFLVDGIPYNTGDGKVDLDDFDIGSINYTEVFKGANAFKYGSYSLGGAINLVPFTGYTADPLTIRTSAGSLGDVQTDASIADIHGKSDYFVSGLGRYHEGGRAHSTEDLERFFGDFGYRINDQTENRLYVTIGNLDRQIPGELTKDTVGIDPLQANAKYLNQNVFRDYSVFRIADKFAVCNDHHQFDVGAVWRYRDLNINELYDTATGGEGISANGSNNVSLTLNFVNRSELFGNRNIITAGAGGTYEFENSTHFQNINGQRGDTIASYSTQAEDVPFFVEVQQYVRKDLSLIAGVQAIYAGRQFHNKFGTTDPDDDDDSTGLDFFGVNPKFGLMYEPDKNIQVFTNVSKSWQPPAFTDMLEFDRDPGETSDFDFTPHQAQYAWTVEIGSRGEEGRFEWELSLYHSWVRDELLEIYDAQGQDTGTTNIARTVHQGVEAELTLDLLRSIFVHSANPKTTDCLKLNQSYMYNDFYFDKDPVYHNNHLGGLPIHLYNAGLTYVSPSGFYCGPAVSCNLEQYPTDQANTLYAGPYAVLNFSIGFQKTKGLSGYFEVRNLLNKHYAATVEPTAKAGGSDEGWYVFEPGEPRSFNCGLQWRW